MVTRQHVEAVLAGADDLVIGAMNDHAAVGLGIGVVHDGAFVYGKGFGWADVSSRRPVTTDTIFRIGSTSKTLTAIGLMQLWEQGRFDLDDPVAEHLRSYRFIQPKGSRPATIRDVMTHTSGAGEFNSLADIVGDLQTTGLGVPYGQRIPTLAEHYRKGVRADSPPGQKWAYANHAIATLGQLVEDLSGEPFADYMRDRVLDPLGMTGSDFLRNDRVRDRLAVGYHFKRGKFGTVRDQEIILAAAGSGFSSVDDMARYLVALTNGGANEHGSVLKPETLQLMMRSHWQVAPGVPFSMGLVFMRDDLDDHAILHHGGGWPGFKTMMRVVPAERLGVIVCSNGDDLSPLSIADSLVRDLLGVPRQGEYFRRTLVREHPELWNELVGVYTPPRGLATNARVWGELGAQAEILVHQGHLAIRALWGPMRKPVRLHAASNDDPLLFAGVYDAHHVTQEIWLRFERSGDGPATAITGAQQLPFRLERRGRFRDVRTLGRAAAVAAAGAVAARRALRS